MPLHTEIEFQHDACQHLADKAGADSAFVRGVLHKPKLWIKGSEDELEQLAGHRSAAAATA
jgi:hypothetical protein